MAGTTATMASRAFQERPSGAHGSRPARRLAGDEANRNEKQGHRINDGPAEDSSGGVLLSHRIAPAVPSAQEDLTSVFGMGTGVTPPA